MADIRLNKWHWQTLGLANSLLRVESIWIKIGRISILAMLKIKIIIITVPQNTKCANIVPNKAASL